MAIKNWHVFSYWTRTSQKPLKILEITLLGRGGDLIKP